MDALLGLMAGLLAILAFCAGLFLVSGQPIWGIIDVAVSRRLSGGAKAAIILLTLLLLGPLMTFLYACFGTDSRVLRRSTIVALVVMLVSAGGVLALAGIHGATQARLHELTGRGSAVPDSVATDIPATDVVAANALDIDDFTAVHYVPVNARKWSVSVADFNVSGPLADSASPVTVPNIYPLNQIAIDPGTGRTYGITTHKFGYIVPATGHFVEIETDPAVTRLSWPSAVAFDEENQRVIVVGRSVAHSYDPATGAWKLRQGFADADLISLTYDGEEGVFFGLVLEFANDQIDSIVRLDDSGSVLSVLRLSEALPVDELPAGRVQLRKAGRFLVILVSAHYIRRDGTDQRVEPRTYVVDPENGDLALVGE